MMIKDSSGAYVNREVEYNDLTVEDEYQDASSYEKL
jgi:hypothetical protein